MDDDNIENKKTQQRTRSTCQKPDPNKAKEYHQCMYVLCNHAVYCVSIPMIYPYHLIIP
jgi:hypothetical protein